MITGYIDLHTHILPEMDDGAGSLEESLDMAVLAAARGTAVIACTSHANGPRSFGRFDAEDFICSCEDLQWELDQAKIPLRLVSGMEIYIEPDTIDRIREKELIPLGNSSYYLIEFPFEESARNMTDTVAQIREAGYRMIIAHPERYECIQNEPGIAKRLAAEGALLQCNGKSLLGQFGRSAAKAAARLLKEGLYICIGSDAHGMRRRTTDLSDVYRHIAKTYGTETADRLMKENPQRILRNDQLL